MSETRDMEERVADLEIGVQQILKETGAHSWRSGLLYNGAWAGALERFVHQAGAKRQGCAGLGGWLLGHRFVARLSESETVFALGKSVWQTFADVKVQGEIPQDRYESTYHGDVCVRCGLVVNAPSPSSPGGDPT